MVLGRQLGENGSEIDAGWTPLKKEYGKNDKIEKLSR